MNYIIGVSILSYNNWRQTKECLDSIMTTYSNRCKVVIIDNCSSDDSFYKLKKCIGSSDIYSDVTLVSSGKNGGYSYGNNYGINILKSDYGCKKIIVTNNDVVFHKGAIEKLENALSYDEKCVIVVPKVIDENNLPITPPTRKKQNILQLVGLISRKNCRYRWEDIMELTKIYSFSGCCLAINVDQFEIIGFFDENVFLYNEENIISYKAKEYELSIYTEPMAVVTHFQGKSTGKSNLFVEKEYLKSSLYYLKNYEKKSKLVLLAYLGISKLKVILKILLNRCSANISFHTFNREILSYFKSLY